MYKLLIVEDEELELTSLNKIIRENFTVFDPVLTANNGDLAIDLALEHSPDIVLMDIHLGSANGLDMSKLILEENSNSKIIVITAHDQFPYAQKAINIGISDYILKPVSTQTLINVVKKQLKKIEDDRERILENLKMAENINRLKDVLANNLTASIINNLAQNYTNDVLTSLGIHFSCASILAIDFHSKDLKLNNTEKTVLKKIIVDSFLKNDFGVSIFPDIVNTNYITLCVFYKNSQSCLDFNLARNIRHEIVMSLHLGIKIGLSEMVYDLSVLNSAYKQAIIALEVGQDSINKYSDFLDPSNMKAEIPDYLNALIPFILKNDQDSIDSIIQKISTEFIKFKYTVSTAKTYLIQLWINLIKELETKVSLRYLTYESLITSLFSEIMNSNTIKDLIDNVQAALKNLTRDIYEVMQNNLNYTAQRAKDYIDQNFSSQLNLNILSEKLNISPYYLSHLFKKDLNINVIDYLNLVRIKKAQELLSVSDMSINEIAIKTGFSDSNYFCRVFKKLTDITPSVYRQRNKHF